MCFICLRGQIYAAVRCFARREYPLMLAELKGGAKTLSSMIAYMERNGK